MLVRVSGHDRPGITAGLMAVLAQSSAHIHDVEQVLVRGRLSLDVLISVGEGQATVKDLLFYGWENGLNVEFDVVDEEPAEVLSRSVVTLIGDAVGPEAFGAVARAIADGGGNIDRIVRLSRKPVTSYELAITDGDLNAMRASLVAVARAQQVDLAIQAEGINRRAKRLVMLDVDSTLIRDEMIELLAEAAGTADRVKAITASAMAGEIDFETSLRERVRTLAGLDDSAITAARERMRLTPGARTFIATLKRIGMKVGIVSGGFTVFTDHLKAELGLDHAFANELEIVDGVLTGEVVGDIIDRERKADVLRIVASAERIPLEQTVAVGDGANDLDMLAAAGLGIAFNAKPIVQEAADTAVSVPYLDAILFFLGLSSSDIWN
ncbi:MAG: phosphoserine phosphatase SerB [Acidimicrobiia bacterium]|nr:phosphoserine phosphatase SerB [Acidimicrobiia bacterium]